MLIFAKLIKNISISIMKKIILFILTVTFLVSCKNDPQKLVKIEAKLLPITDSLQSKQEIEDFIQPYKEKVESEMNKVLSYTPIDLLRTDGALESSLGNLMADLCFERANPVFNSRTGKNIDFAMFNYGGIRAGISKGNITTEHAFNLMPFENSLVIVELSAAKIIELVNYLIEHNRAHPLSKHINLSITKNEYDLKINNEPLDKTKTYFVLTSDYLQNGGDLMNFFKGPISLHKTDYKVRSAIIDYFAETDTIKVKLDNRFVKIK